MLAPPVVVARFPSRAAVAPVARAALDSEIVYVPLAAPPPAGRVSLQLWVHATHLATVNAESVGRERDGEYPLRLAVDGVQREELEALATRTSVMPVAFDTGQYPARLAQDPTEGGGLFASEEQTLASRSSPLRALSERPLPPGSKPPSRPSVPPPSSAKEPRRRPSVEMAKPPSVPLPMRVESDRGSGEHRPDEPTQIFDAQSQRKPIVRDDMPEETQTLVRDRLRSASAVSWNIRLSATTKDPLTGRVISGKYILDSVIGGGAMGIVFKARHRDLARTVAIKVLHPRYRDDPALLGVFRTEARAASQLEHPNVARIYDYGQEPDGLVYIVMEYLSGYTLGSVLGSRRKLAKSRTVDVMLQICAALSAAHDRGIVHRDVKPDNVVLVPAQDDEGQPTEVVKVCDFGIAALGNTIASLTSTDGPPSSVPAGTPEYMAPEQVTGAAVSAATDIYACGVLMYEMLTGQVPFTGKQPFQIFLKHTNEVPRRPSELAPEMPPALEAIILRALEKQPDRRFAHAREMRAVIRRAMA